MKKELKDLTMQRRLQADRLARYSETNPAAPTTGTTEREPDPDTVMHLVKPRKYIRRRMHQASAPAMEAIRL